MATAATQATIAALTPTTDQTPAVAEIQNELSGSQWVNRFPGSSSTDELTEEFRTSVDNFVSAMRNAGATVTISATYRPPERAYLMHWSWKIVKQNTAPASVPAMDGVQIDWDHGDNAASVAAARAMVNGYGIQNLNVPPALSSRHTERRAIDMSISWSGTLRIENASGTNVEIATTPRTGMNTQLQDVGRTYGVIKFVGGESDRPHWSSDGH